MNDQSDLMERVGVFFLSAWFVPTLVYLIFILLYMFGIVGMDILGKVFWQHLFCQKVASFPLGAAFIFSLFVGAIFVVMRLAWYRFWRTIIVGLSFGILAAWILIMRVLS